MDADTNRIATVYAMGEMERTSPTYNGVLHSLHSLASGSYSLSCPIAVFIIIYSLSLGSFTVTASFS